MEREQRKFAMFQVNIDESEDQQVFSMGGYVATAENWIAFSKEWEDAINTLNNGQPFKMSEVSHWGEERQRQNVGFLYDIIQRHASLGIGISVDVVALKEVMANFPNQMMKSPYYFCMHQVIVRLMNRWTGYQGNKVEFIFDDGRQTNKLLQNWDIFMAGAPEQVKNAIVGKPQFRSDTHWMPLQAADMKAWWVRRHFRHKLLGEALPRSLRNRRSDLMGMHIGFDRKRIVEYGSAQYFAGIMRMMPLSIAPMLGSGPFTEVGGED